MTNKFFSVNHPGPSWDIPVDDANHSARKSEFKIYIAISFHRMISTVVICATVAICQKLSCFTSFHGTLGLYFGRETQFAFTQRSRIY